MSDSQWSQNKDDNYNVPNTTYTRVLLPDIPLVLKSNMSDFFPHSKDNGKKATKFNETKNENRPDSVATPHQADRRELNTVMWSFASIDSTVLSLPSSRPPSSVAQPLAKIRASS